MWLWSSEPPDVPGTEHWRSPSCNTLYGDLKERYLIISSAQPSLWGFPWMSNECWTQRPTLILPYMAEVINTIWSWLHLAVNVSQLQYSLSISESKRFRTGLTSEHLHYTGVGRSPSPCRRIVNWFDHFYFPAVFFFSFLCSNVWLLMGFLPTKGLTFRNKKDCFTCSHNFSITHKRAQHVCNNKKKKKSQDPLKPTVQVPPA